MNSCRNLCLLVWLLRTSGSLTGALTSASIDPAGTSTLNQYKALALFVSFALGLMSKRLSPQGTCRYTKTYPHILLRSKNKLVFKGCCPNGCSLFLATASTWFSAVGPFFDYVLCEPALWFPLPWGELVSNPPPNLHPNIREGWIRGLGLVAVWLYTQPVRCSLW